MILEITNEEAFTLYAALQQAAKDLSKWIALIVNPVVKNDMTGELACLRNLINRVYNLCT